MSGRSRERKEAQAQVRASVDGGSKIGEEHVESVASDEHVGSVASDDVQNEALPVSLEPSEQAIPPTGSRRPRRRAPPLVSSIPRPKR